MVLADIPSGEVVISNQYRTDTAWTLYDSVTSLIGLYVVLFRCARRGWREAAHYRGGDPAHRQHALPQESCRCFLSSGSTQRLPCRHAGENKVWDS
jgi:hypothetical protein